MKSYINIKFCMCIERPNSDTGVSISGVNMPNSPIQGGDLSPVTDGSISQPRYTKCKDLFCQMILLLNIKNIHTTKIQV